MAAHRPESDPHPESPPVPPRAGQPAVGPLPTAESLAPADTVTSLPADLERVPAPDPVAEVVPLIVKAVGMLPPDERDQVYTWLLERGLASSLGSSAMAGRRIRSHVLSLQASGVLPGAQSSGQQVVPIRFPADQHAALRGWCAEHGFSMATVIRGLVARFLEGQLRAQGD
jgi:hypothetical protein